jgi:hypothetical protein
MVIIHRLSIRNVTYGYDEETQKWYELSSRSIGPMPLKIGEYIPLVTQRELDRLWVDLVHEEEKCLSLTS